MLLAREIARLEDDHERIDSLFERLERRYGGAPGSRSPGALAEILYNELQSHLNRESELLRRVPEGTAGELVASLKLQHGSLRRVLQRWFHARRAHDGYRWFTVLRGASQILFRLEEEELFEGIGELKPAPSSSNPGGPMPTFITRVPDPHKDPRRTPDPAPPTPGPTVPPPPGDPGKPNPEPPRPPRREPPAARMREAPGREVQERRDQE